jgi:hypothetical protein
MSTIFYLVSHREKAVVELGKFGCLYDVDAFQAFLCECAMCGPFDVADDMGGVDALLEQGYRRIGAAEIEKWFGGDDEHSQSEDGP